jgi:hypothetical protein
MENPSEEEKDSDTSIEYGLSNDEGVSTEKSFGGSEKAAPNANNFGESSSYTYEEIEFVEEEETVDFDASEDEDEDIIEEEYEEEVVVDDDVDVDNPHELNSPKQVQFEGVPCFTDEPKTIVQKTLSEEGGISDPCDKLDSDILAAVVPEQTSAVKEFSYPMPGGEQQKENEQKGNGPWDETEGNNEPGMDPGTGVKHAEELRSRLASVGRQTRYDEYYSKLKGEEEYDVAEDDESDESEFTDPIPEVVHSTVDSFSSYDEAHEFDASDSDLGQEEMHENENIEENIMVEGELEDSNDEAEWEDSNDEAELEDSNDQSYAEDTASGDVEQMNSLEDSSFIDDDNAKEDHIFINPGLDGESHEHYVSKQPQDSGNVMTGNLLDSENHDPEMKLQPRRVSKSSFGGGSFFDEAEIDAEAEAKKAVEMKDRRKYCIPILFLAICTLAATVIVLSIVGTRDGAKLSSRVVDSNSTQSPTFLRARSPSPTPSPASRPIFSPTPPPTSGPISFRTPRPTVAPGPPDNDICLAATGMLPNDAPVEGTLFLAGSDDVDQCQMVPIGEQGVWYFVIGTGGEMLAHTCNKNTAFDTRITVLTGSCANPECVEADDNFCGRQAAVSWMSNIQQIYWILVHGDAQRGVDPSFQLSVLTRFNDECSIAVGPVQVGEDNPPVIGDTRPATVNDITCGNRVNDSPSVWYRVRGTGGEMTVNVCEGPVSFGARISLLTGGCADLDCLAQSNGDCVLSWQSTAFRTYYIMISGLTSTSTGVFGLKVT